MCVGPPGADAEVCCQRVREAEGQYLAADDVEDAHQIHKPWAIGKYVMSLDHTWLGRSIARPESRYGQIAVDVIRNVATSIGPKDVFHARNRLAGLASDGMADCGPLQRLVANTSRRKSLQRSRIPKGARPADRSDRP